MAAEPRGGRRPACLSHAEPRHTTLPTTYDAQATSQAHRGNTLRPRPTGSAGLHGFFVEKPGWIFESSTTLSSWSPATVTPSSAGVSTFGSNLQRQFFRFRKP